jgi:hypothetical protein
MDCLENIIGISRSDCPCIQADLPIGHNVSNSGLYMDELAESPFKLSTIKAIADCGRNMGKILTDSRTQAIAELKREVYKQLNGRFKQRFKGYSGNAGSSTFTNNLNIGTNYAGVVISSKNIKGSSFTLRNIYTFFNATANFPVFVYRGYQVDNNVELLEQFTVNSTAGADHSNPITPEREYYLSDGTGKSINYYFLYELQGQQPKDNVTSCGCGNTEVDMKQFLTVQGITGNDLTALSSFGRTNHINGLMLNITANCGNEGIICSALSNPETYAMIAHSIQKKAVEFLIKAVLNSDTISRDNLAKREQMAHNSYGLAKRFLNDVQWIAENMTIEDNDCYVCNPGKAAYVKTGILL